MCLEIPLCLVHERPEVEQRYSCTHALTSLLDGDGGQSNAPATLPTGMSRYPFYRRMIGPQGRSGGVQGKSSPQGIPSPDQPASTGYAILTPVHMFCVSHYCNITFKFNQNKHLATSVQSALT